MTVVVLVALAIGQAGPARSDEALGYLAVYQDETAGSCEFTPAGASYAYVVLTHSIPAQQLTFTAPKPSFIGTILFETSAFSITGDTQTGVTVDLGTCMTPPVTVITILHSGVGSTGGCPIWPVGEEYAYTYEFVDCDGVTRQGKSAVRESSERGCCDISNNILTPYEPDPPDGTSGVPTNLTLSWILPEQAGDQGIRVSEMPYWPTGWVPFPGDYFSTYEPENLQPNTLYYWAVGLIWGSGYSGVVSDWWTFTTGEGPIATEVTTWGRIKALYQ